MNSGLWTDDDITELVRLVKKYPNGTTSRWEIIGGQMNRAVNEVTLMAGRIKDAKYRPMANSVAEAIVSDTQEKVKKVMAPVNEKASDAIWTQDQQQLLETAIVKYTKTMAGDRWQKIASTVPGKTKEECLARYKYLVQKVKEQQKEKEAATKAAAEVAADEVIAEPTIAEDESEPEQEAQPLHEAEPVQKKGGGKPRNKRKERKKRMEFSSDEDYENDGELEWPN